MSEVDIVAKIWPFIRTLGSLGGLVSVAFLLWDRTTKSRPYARFLREDENENPEMDRVVLRIFNPSNRLMLAQFDEACDPKNLYLNADDKTFNRAGIDGIMLVKPDSFVDLDVIEQDGWNKLSPDKKVWAIYKWKYAQPFLYRKWRTERIGIIKQDFESVSHRV